MLANFDVDNTSKHLSLANDSFYLLCVSLGTWFLCCLEHWRIFSQLIKRLNLTFIMCGSYPETCASSETLLSNVHNGMFEKAGEAEKIFCAFGTDFRKFYESLLAVCEGSVG